MFVLPLSADLRLNKLPLVTYSVVIVCLFIHYNQQLNSIEITNQAAYYCESTDSSQLPTHHLEEDVYTLNDCIYLFRFLHERASHGGWEQLRSRLQSNSEIQYSDDEIDQFIIDTKRHLDAFQQAAPKSLDGILMHFPDEFAPITYLTSAIAHGNWFHVISNIIFFLAFAPALEILINNRYKYFVLLIAISVVTAITYSLSIIVSGSEPLPTLGLSGVVTGMIGLSGYLMPHARIRVFVWFIVFFKNVFIPAWILALWYIGFDIYYMLTDDGSSGINFVSHVSGGISGYILGIIWFKQRREQIQDELNDEIDSMRAERSQGGLTVQNRGRSKELIQKHKMKQLEQVHEDYTSKLFQYIRRKQNSAAVALFITENDIHAANLEVYEEHFKEVKDWGPSKYLLCIGRLIIHLLMQQKKYARALLYAKECHEASENFILADPSYILLLAKLAVDTHQYQLAYLLVKDADKRYGNYVEHHQCALMEIELLWQYLNEPNKAQEKIDALLESPECPIRDDLIMQASLMK